MHSEVNEERPVLPAITDPAARPMRSVPRWRYGSSCAAGHGIGHLRIWTTDAFELLAIVTETGSGATVTNSADRIAAQLATDHPHSKIHLMERWPGGILEPHLDSVTIDPHGQPAWHRVYPVGTRHARAADHHAWWLATGRHLLPDLHAELATWWTEQGHATRPDLYGTPFTADPGTHETPGLVTPRG